MMILMILMILLPCAMVVVADSSAPAASHVVVVFVVFVFVVAAVAADDVPVSTLYRFPQLFMWRPEPQHPYHLGLQRCLWYHFFDFPPSKPIGQAPRVLFVGHLLRFRVNVYLNSRFLFVSSKESLSLTSSACAQACRDQGLIIAYSSGTYYIGHVPPPACVLVQVFDEALIRTYAQQVSFS